MILESTVRTAYKRKALAERRFGTTSSVAPISMALIHLNELAKNMNLPHVVPDKTRSRGTRLTKEAMHAHVNETPHLPMPVLEQHFFSEYDLKPNKKKTRAVELAVKPGDAIMFCTSERKPFKLTLRPTFISTELKMSGSAKHPVVLKKNRLKINMEQPPQNTEKVTLHAGLSSPYDRRTDTIVLGTKQTQGKRAIVEVPRSFFIGGIGQIDVGFPLQLEGNEPVEVLIKPYGLHVHVTITHELYGPEWTM